MLDIDPLINRYHDQVIAIKQDSNAICEELDNLLNELDAHNLQFSQKTGLMKVITFVAYKFKLWSIQDKRNLANSEFNRIPSRENALLRELILECGRVKLTSDVGNSLLAEMEQDHFKLCSLLESTRAVHSAGNRAVSSIMSALDSVDSAQTLEMLDGFTQSKAISTLSTIENMSVSEAVGQANRAVEEFQAGLKSHQKIVVSLEHSTSLEIIDFAIDISLGGLADTIGSVISYLALSNTDANLERARVDVEKVLAPISEQLNSIKDKVKTHEAELLVYKTSARARVIPLLSQKGVSIPEGFLDTIKDLYAPSAKSPGSQSG